MRAGGYFGILPHKLAAASPRLAQGPRQVVTTLAGPDQLLLCLLPPWPCFR